MAKQSIFGRISTLIRANVNSLIDQAEDPQKMLDQMVLAIELPSRAPYTVAVVVSV